MVPVRIAADLSATDIVGVRWVLVDIAQADLPVPIQPVPVATAGPAPAPRRPWLAKLLLLAAALALAWGVTLMAASRMRHTAAVDSPSAASAVR